MPIELVCPKCKRSLKVDDRHAGRTAQCPTCKSSVKVPKPAAAADPANPFAFTPAAPPPPDADDGPPPDPELAEKWDTPRRGLRLAWIGTVMFTGAPVAILMLAIASNMIFGSILITEALFSSPDEVAGPAVKPAGVALLILQGAVILFAAAMLLGPLVRLFGFVHCFFLPLGAPGRIWALALVACELLTLGSFGLIFGARYLPDIQAKLPALSYLPLAGLLGLVGGIVFLLLHLRDVAAALQSKPLRGGVKNYAIWYGGTLGLVTGFIGLSLLRDAPGFVLGLGLFSDAVSCLGIVVYLVAPVILLLKYMHLLDLAWDEIRKRAGRWRSA